MCGIFGFAGIPEDDQHEIIFKIMTNLALNTEKRGRHAFGYIALGNDGVMYIDKAPITASEFINSESWRNWGTGLTPMFVGHCRSATYGNPSENMNNHPFISHNQKYAFVHNGTVYGWKHIANKNKILMESECDSEIILRVIERHQNPINGISDVFSKVFTYDWRYGACVLADTKRKCLYLFRSSQRPLHVIRLIDFNGAIIFASGRDIIMDSIKPVLGKFESDWIDKDFLCKPYRVYKINFNEDINWRKESRIPSITTFDLPRSEHTPKWTSSTEVQPTLFKDFPPEETSCVCGNTMLLWPDEVRICSKCKKFFLQLEEVPMPVTKETEMNLHCEMCGHTWMQKGFRFSLNCPKCSSSWVAILGDYSQNQALVWTCNDCKSRFIGVSHPTPCSKCGGGKFVISGNMEGIMLPKNWGTKQCHNCRKPIPSDGPSRCQQCKDREKKR